MRKAFAAIIAFAVASFAVATTTWTSVSGTPGYVRCVQGSNPTAAGTEPAPISTTTAPTEGIDLRDLDGLSVVVETLNGGAMTAGNKFQAWVWAPKNQRWYPVSDGSLDFATYATSVQAVPGFTVSADYGRIAWEPVTVGTPTKITICGTRRYPAQR